MNMQHANALEKLLKIFANEMSFVDQMIEDRMQSKNAARIPDITKHLTGAGGKRIRPLLTIASSALCGEAGDNHLKLATAVEFIHSATLLHDDVVDESEKRRGRPTANNIWDNKSAVLVGDYLFSRSFQLMVETGSIEVLAVLANASAVIAEGEVLQLQASSDISTTEHTYFQVIEGKTAALFAAACKVGAMVANAPKAKTDALNAYGLNLGLSFQIADDILDYVADERFGKTIGNDFAERKLTLPLIRAIATSDDEELQFWQRTIGKGEQVEGDLDKALALIEKHNTLESAKATAFELAKSAKSALDEFPESEIKQLLRDLADLVVVRLV